MPENPSNAPAQKANAPRPIAANEWRPFGSLRREIDRLFDDFDRDFWGQSFRRSLADWEPRWIGDRAPAVDVVERERAYEITAELPGIDQNNIDVKFANGVLTIKAEKKQEAEENKKNYYMSERRYGSFERSFQAPDGVDSDKIEASFSNGVLKVTLPKSVEAQKSSKTIAVKAS